MKGHLGNGKLTLLSVWTILFLESGIVKAFGVFVPVLQDQFATYTRTIGVIVSLIFFGGYFLSFSCIGVTLALGLLSSYFTTDYAVALNIVTSGFPLGIVTFAPIAQQFIDTYGWRGAMLLFGGLNVHYVAAATLLKPLKACRSIHKPAFYGSLIKSLEDNTQNFTFNIHRSLLTNRAFLVVLIVQAICGYGQNGWVVYLVSFGQSKGLTPKAATVTASISGMGAFFIKITMAIIQGKTSSRLLLYIGSIIVTVCYVAMFFATSFVALSSLSFVLGAGLGIASSQVYVIANDSIKADESIIAVAWIHLSYGIGYIINGFITGLIYDISGHFGLALIQLGAVSFMACLVLGAEDLWKYFERK
ncbi:monocarboxylate transporter 12-like [Amphiura filiformis]|uniref:monocarboxylate transporter 12-like n=1 Tax=Amphiura filiformis TaxID=82378 RepID=UPI003B21B388